MTEGRKFPSVGDIVWIDGWGGVIGLFERYDPHGKMLMLSWPREEMFSGIWPGEKRGFSPVEFDRIKILTPFEVLAKVDRLVKLRDGKIQKKLSEEANRAFNFSAIDIFSN